MWTRQRWFVWTSWQHTHPSLSIWRPLLGQEHLISGISGHVPVTHQWLYFLSKPGRTRVPAPIMYLFWKQTSREHSDLLHHCVVQRACTASCRKTLHGIVRAAEKIGGTPPPSIRALTAPTSPCSWCHIPITELFQPSATLGNTTNLWSRSPPGSQETAVCTFSAPPPFWTHKLWTLSLRQGDSKIREHEYHTK